LEYAIKAADLRNFTKTGNYAGVIKTLRDIYEDDIVILTLELLQYMR